MEEAILGACHFDEEQRALLHITYAMLTAIDGGDTEAYASLCTPDLSCFEDVCRYRIDGVEFHTSLIQQMAVHSHNRPVRFDMLSPRVQIHGDAAVVTYTRLLTYDAPSSPSWRTFNETRVFVRIEGAWKMAHFHRSPT